MKYWRTFIHTVIDLIFPHACVGCHRTGMLLCESCSRKLVSTPTTVTSTIVANFSYQEPIIRSLLWQLKYHGTRDVADILAPHVIPTLRTMHSSVVLVPVPISKRRRRERGFNQAEVLAQAISALDPDHIRYDTTLVQKIRHTKPQVACRSRRERQDNLAGAFGAGPSSPLPHTHYVVLDDVTTTGTTLAAVMDILTKNGAQHVRALAIAHG